MPTSVTTGTTLYLYGITSADSPPQASMVGVEGASVEYIAEGRLAAVASHLAARNVRPRRANLSAHHQVLRSLSEAQTVLPMVFGTMAGGEEELRALLRHHQEPLCSLLERLKGKVEMSLKVYWDTPNIIEYFVANHRELEEMRNRLFRFGHAPTTEERIELGRLFESLLSSSRERHTARIMEALAPCSVEARAGEPGDERMVMRLACLVEKGRQREWEEGVRRAASLFDNHYCFNYSGPFAPQTFAQIELTAV
ncbi:MAG: GvpL/GvpF family gas vesicle protein [Planctomycetia bacterium]|nr:GvpL/GvpF family gas vesicle protein [Planctomycetia bacterium]